MPTVRYDVDGPIAIVTIDRPDVREAWDKQGAVPLKMSPAELDKYLRADIEKWAHVVKVSGAQAQ